MPIPSGQAIDPDLTRYAQGYALPRLTAGAVLFPEPTDRSDRSKTTVAAPRFGSDRVTVIALDNLEIRGSSAYYTIRSSFDVEIVQLKFYGLQIEVSDFNERRAADYNYSFATKAAADVLWAYSLALEGAKLAAARNTANYPSDHVVTLSGTQKWSDNSSDPVAHVRDGIAKVQSKVIIDPDTMIISKRVADRLAYHPAIRGLVSNAPLVGGVPYDAFARIFNIERVIVANTPALAPGAATASDLLDDDVILVCSRPGTEDSPMPCWGTFWRMAGMPRVLEAQRDPNAPRVVWPLQDWNAIVVNNPSAGYLIRDVL